MELQAMESSVKCENFYENETNKSLRKPIHFRNDKSNSNLGYSTILSAKSQ